LGDMSDLRFDGIKSVYLGSLKADKSCVTNIYVFERAEFEVK